MTSLRIATVIVSILSAIAFIGAYLATLGSQSETALDRAVTGVWLIIAALVIDGVRSGIGRVIEVLEIRRGVKR